MSRNPCIQYSINSFHLLLLITSFESGNFIAAFHNNNVNLSWPYGCARVIFRSLRVIKRWIKTFNYCCTTINVKIVLTIRLKWSSSPHCWIHTVNWNKIKERKSMKNFFLYSLKKVKCKFIRASWLECSSYNRSARVTRGGYCPEQCGCQGNVSPSAFFIP